MRDPLLLSYGTTDRETIDRVFRGPGWDSKVRKRVRQEVGSIRDLAEEVGVEVFDGEHDMETWSRIVQHFGGTDRIEHYLNERNY